MPTYDYVCAACGHALEIFQPMSEAPKRKCPQCKKSKLERRIGAGAGFLFKGSGFYLTDYRSKSYTAQSEAERKQESGTAAPASPGADAKPTAPASAVDSTAKKTDAKSATPAKPAPAAKSAAPAKKKPAPGD